MKITFEYDDEDRAEAQRALRVDDYGLVLWDMDEWLREFMRYKDESEWPDVPQIRTKLSTLMDQHGVEYPG